MVAASVGEELDEEGGLLPGSVPLGGKRQMLARISKD